MIKKIKIALLALVAVATLSAPALVPVVAHAQQPKANIEDSLCAGANLNVKDTTCPAGSGEEAADTINNTIALVINTFSVIVGVISVIMIIFGGLRYIISGGESSNVASAKNTIIFAVVGLIVVALSQFIVRFVLQRVNPT